VNWCVGHKRITNAAEAGQNVAPPAQPRRGQSRVSPVADGPRRDSTTRLRSGLEYHYYFAENIIHFFLKRFFRNGLI